MIADGFDDCTKANLEVALKRACERLGENGAYHQARSFVAGKLLDCAHSGRLTLGALTDAGLAAAVELNQLVADYRRPQI
jgi:hypothetical protein